MFKLNPIMVGSKRPFVEAHRGAPKFCPENTLPAFKKAVELKADLIEIDVQLSKDKEIVVYHDYHLDAKTNGTGLLKEYTLNELKRLDTGSWFSPEYAGERMLTLEETLLWAKDKIWLSIEMKHVEFHQEEFVKKVVHLIEYFKMESQVQIISFNHSMLAKVRKYSKKIMTSAICPCRIADPIKYLRSFDAQVYNGPGYYLSKEVVEAIQQAGLFVNGGMVDDPLLWNKYQEWGVDLMCTNVPDIMIRERGDLN